MIEDSHVEGWEGPEGFQLTPDQRSFHRVGTEPNGYVGFDVPGVVPLFTDPGDENRLRLSHLPLRIPETESTVGVRLSCGIGLRPRGYPVNAPWPLSENAKAFLEAFPGRLQPLVEGYVGIDTEWRGDDA